MEELEQKDKYYIPSLEEFFVGFEYEYLNAFGKEFGKWTTEIVPRDASFFHLNNLLATCCVRVKYLTAEDVESLGFIQSGLNKEIFLKKVENFRIYENVTIGINIGYMGNTAIFFVLDERAIPAGVNLFVGKIKNISELKKVLQMIGVL